MVSDLKTFAYKRCEIATQFFIFILLFIFFSRQILQDFFGISPHRMRDALSLVCGIFSWCVLERGRLEYEFKKKKMFYICWICEWATKLPQNPIILEYYQPGILLPSPGGVNWYEWQFWTPAGFCDLGQQADLYTKIILVTVRSWKFLIYEMDFWFCTD